MAYPKEAIEGASQFATAADVQAVRDFAKGQIQQVEALLLAEKDPEEDPASFSARVLASKVLISAMQGYVESEDALLLCMIAAPRLQNGTPLPKKEMPSQPLLWWILGFFLAEAIVIAVFLNVS